MGAAWAGGSEDEPPEKLHASILFAPVGELVRPGLAPLRRGGRLAVAGIPLSAIPSLDYDAHLFQERELVSVTANARADARELLELAGELAIRTQVAAYPLEEANRALLDLKQDRIAGAAALVPGS
jgi:propanol-preferring alcohol dehydrogenase